MIKIRESLIKLDLSSIYHVSRLSHGIDPAVISLVEDSYDFSFPPSYAECACKLGYGSLSHIVDIYDPWTCVKDTEFLRRLHRQHPDVINNEIRTRVESSWILGRAAGELTIVHSTVDGLIQSIDDLDEVVPLGRDYLEALGAICAQYKTDRLVFHPFDKRQRFVFDCSSTDQVGTTDDWFDTLVDAFLWIGIDDYREQAGGKANANRSATIYFSDFGGWVSVEKGGAGVSLTLGKDAGAAHPTLDSVLRIAAAYGFVARPHPHD
jgi:hypothetical protein